MQIQYKLLNCESIILWNIKKKIQVIQSYVYIVLNICIIYDISYVY